MYDFVRQYKKELDNKHTYYKKMLENVRQNIYDQRLNRKNRLNIIKIRAEAEKSNDSLHMSVVLICEIINDLVFHYRDKDAVVPALFSEKTT